MLDSKKIVQFKNITMQGNKYGMKNGYLKIHFSVSQPADRIL